MEEQPIENKIAKSGLVILEMSRFTFPEKIVSLDIAPVLWEGIALKEKDFRAYVADTDWSEYRNKYVAVFCSADAIIPNWAFMLLASALTPYTENIWFGTPSAYASHLVRMRIRSLDPGEFKDQRVMVKGCGDKSIDFAAFGEIAARLSPVVRTLMFGEPCGMIPIFKRKL